MATTIVRSKESVRLEMLQALKDMRDNIYSDNDAYIKASNEYDDLVDELESI
jgi:hypothetical protein